MKLRNKKTGEIVEAESCNSYTGTIGLFFEKGRETDRAYETLAELNEEWEDFKPAEPLIKDEKIRKAVRAWADVLEIDEAEFYGSNTWIGLRTTNSRTGWSSKFELDYYGSENTLVPFRVYTIAELCGEDEE